LFAGAVALLPFPRARAARLSPAPPQRCFRTHGSLQAERHVLLCRPKCKDSDRSKPGRITRPQPTPLFTAPVLSTVQVRFGYRFGAAGTHRLNRKARLDGRSPPSSGWQKTFELARPQRFRGDQTALVATLDLPRCWHSCPCRRPTTAVGGSYTLTLTPQLNVHGRWMHDRYRPASRHRLKFALNKLEVQPIVGGGAQSTAHSTAAPFASSAAGSVAGRRQQSSLLARRPRAAHRLRQARWIALGGTAILICALACAARLPRGT